MAAVPLGPTPSRPRSPLPVTHPNWTKTYTIFLRFRLRRRSEAMVLNHTSQRSVVLQLNGASSATVGALKPRVSKKPLPDFGAEKPYPPALPEKEEYVVEFVGPDDPLHPQKWTLKKKSINESSGGR
ncbi:uncharacterized protein ACLA_045340 [Aspergillus clavatus NRRL 1]|uniref:Uncharacterized protein n=1 Tax=Aspergillus clavatus (strain ATCC 1007 / CBS 513.65 / DSM 816 / NCTC 3887 / NRRL 1 / QM 1276 / 107) TaxID=344612 RepID=A1CGR4_ASPCL|nr:uncharacterized protein ACLA_045340 [Aspergillus clavatus NRRL 1]EAW10069.1 hypothetical protein ACLA_045340 [Aspergillus clavatus NRRL 1]